ncbi:MAG TPA: PD-(D/E)XK nuclease family protein, partial [Terriglobales bacterium]|nr:PD-(D/E)XK nuclease family protein [Terriglobales bacterium]
PAAEGIDHDALAPEAAPTASSRGTELIRLHDFPAGARAGNLIHKVFELLDFGAPRAELAAIVERQLGRYSIEAKWADTLSDAIADVLDADLPVEPGLRLRHLPRQQRLDEMEFLLPVIGEGSRLNPASLAETFARHASAAVSQGYADSLQRLRFAELHGFLKGFVDLVFVHGERWYVVDYKSNRLGLHRSDYSQARMQREMCDHHYFLQYHLYVVALQRHLRLRLPGYDYQRHFGGVLYLFVRGMAAGVPNGIFADRPSRPMIDALDELLR